MHTGLLSRARGLAALLLLASCAEPHYTNGGLRCAPTGRACPDHFYCADDGHCWQNGSAPDLGVGQLDLGAADLSAGGPDFAQPTDLAGLDLARRDLALILMDMQHPDAGNPSLCSGLTVKLCDGFEGALNTSRWNNDISNGTATIDTSQSYRGASSLHLHTNPEPSPNAEPQANLQNTNALPITTTLYLRAWVLFPATTPTAFDQFFNFVQSSSGHGLAFSAVDGHPELNDYASGMDNESAQSLTNGAWTCLQMEIPQNASGTVRLFIGGVEVTDIDESGVTPPLFDQMYLGLDWYGNPASFPATEMWIDEVIVDDKPTTCAE